MIHRVICRELCTDVQQAVPQLVLLANEESEHCCVRASLHTAQPCLLAWPCLLRT